LRCGTGKDKPDLDPRFHEIEVFAEGLMLHRFAETKYTEHSRLLSRGSALVVDEDPADLVYYRTVLQRAGCEVVTCGSYKEALDCLGSENFDLVVVSQGSSNFEGRRVLERALALDRDRQVLVVAHSLNMSCYLDAMQLGARDYLEEPVPEHEMIRAAETCLGSRAVAA
jgi:DNA-binding NtrC family response regulator